MLTNAVVAQMLIHNLVPAHKHDLERAKAAAASCYRHRSGLNKNCSIFSRNAPQARLKSLVRDLAP